MSSRSGGIAPTASCESGSASVRAPGVQVLAHFGHKLEEAWLLPRLGRPRLWQVDLDDSGDPPGPRRHDDNSRREEDGLGDGVRDEDDSRLQLTPDAQELHVQALASHLVQRSKWLVHQQ